MPKSADNSTDMIMPMLREMRAENVRLHEDTRTRTDKRFNIVEARLNKIEDTMMSYRQALCLRHIAVASCHRRIRGADRSSGEESEASGEAQMSADMVSLISSILILRSRASGVSKDARLGALSGHPSRRAFGAPQDEVRETA